MPNPGLLPCDTDALIQLFLTAAHTKSLLPLRMLKDDYGIQPSIVVEVEMELMQSRKFGTKFAPELRKAVGNGTIEILDATAFAKYVPGHLAKGVFGNFQTLGLQYNKYADRGESYTLAAAVTLNVPALSNDKSALDALDINGMVLPTPVLRAFDLLSFCFQVGALEEREGLRLCSEGAKAKERACPRAVQERFIRRWLTVFFSANSGCGKAARRCPSSTRSWVHHDDLSVAALGALPAG